MQESQSQKPSIIAAWIIVLAASTLPKVILQEIFHQTVSADQQSLIAAIVVLIPLLISIIWEPLRKLRTFLILFFILIAVEWMVYTKLDTLPFYRSALKNPSFNVYMLAEQSLRLLVTIGMILTLLIIKKKPAAFFLVKGDLSARVEPVRWLGVSAGSTWRKFGTILALCISLGTLTFLLLAGRPSLDIIIKALPFLPFILLAALLNSFNEEMTYKASFLAILEDKVGGRQALLLMAAYFGIGHYYGVPYGIIGVLMAGFLGWILGKSMLETRGFLWAWFIHFLQDILIFSFMAIGSITAGGG